MPIEDRRQDIGSGLASVVETVQDYTQNQTFVTRREQRFDQPVTVVLDQKEWVRTPNYKSIRAVGGRLPNNYFRKDRFEKDTGPMTLHSVVDASGYFPNGTPYGRYTVTQGSAPMVYVLFTFPGYTSIASSNALASKLINKMKGQTFNAPLFLAEANKTIDLVLDTARRLNKSYRQLRRGRLDLFLEGLGLVKAPLRKKKKFDRAFQKNPADTAAQAMLEYSYGWTPLLMDVEEAAKTLARHVVDQQNPRKEASVLRVRAQIVEKAITVGPVTQSSLLGFNFAYREVVLREETMVGVWHFRLKPGIPALTLGLTSAAGTIWELVPFSFIADWFLPIGSFLDSLDSPLFYDHVAYTIGSSCFTQVDYKDEGSDGHWRLGGQTRAFSHRWLPQGGPPTVELKNLTFRPKLNLKRLAISASLLQVFTHKR